MARHSITGKLGVALVTPSTTGPNADLTLGGVSMRTTEPGIV